MKLIKHGKLLVLALCIFMLGANIVFVQAMGEDEIKSVSTANQVENYNLKRVLKKHYNFIGVKKNQYILHYEHIKTGAQFVCYTDFDYDNLEIFYRVPPENDNGVSHALEHCCGNNIMIEPEDNVALACKASTFPSGLMFSTCFANGNFDNIDILTDSLKNRKFLEDESIFKRQVFNQVKGHDGSILTVGRMFLEMMQKDKYKWSTYLDKIYNYEIMNRGNKLKFESGGILEKIPNCSYKEVCDACNKYIHPSNSLVVIKSKQFKDVMVHLDKKFMKCYDRKNIDIDYKLKEKGDFEFFSQYDVKEVNSIFSKNYDYCGVAIYPLKGIKNDRMKTFNNLCYAIDCDKFYQKLVDIGYTDCKFQLCEALDCSYLRIAVAGNDIDKFSKDILTKNFDKILKEALNFNECKDSCENMGFKYIAGDDVMASYAICGAPFDDRFFTIKNNEFVNDEDDFGIDKNLCLEVLKPEKIVLLTRDKSASMPECFACRYQISFEDKDKEMSRLAMRILNRGLVSKELQKRGYVYSNMYTKTDFNDKRSFCFYSDETVAFDNITDFFKHDFNEKVKNFVVSDELFNLVKYNIVNNNNLVLQAVSFCHSDEKETVIEEKILDKEYFSTKLETKRDISQISKKEIQDFIRSAKFVGYATVKLGF